MRTRAFWGGWLAGMATAALVVCAIPFTGVINMAASGGPGLLDRAGAKAHERSLAVRAPRIANPVAGMPDERAHGFDHYGEDCVVCHGAPGIEPMSFVGGMQPGPPKLWSEDVQSMSDGDLFRIVKHGVRMTGMPAFGNHHTDVEIWGIVAFLRDLKNIDETERSKLRGIARAVQPGESGG